MATSSFYNSSGSTPAVENSIQTAVQEAAGSATQAATSANNAATSETNAQSSLNSFQQYYLGAYSSAPSTTQSGSMYFDTGTSQLYIWSGTSWDVTASANNLQDTDGLTEGTSNLYFTDERVDDRVNSLLTAGSNITLNYDDAANTLTIASTASGGGGGSSTFTGLTDTFSSYTGQAYRYLMVNSSGDGVTTVTPNTDDVSEGSSNLYYTDERVDDRVSGLLTAGSNITLNYDDAANTLTIASTASGGLTDLSSSDTDDLSEGTSNLYHTDERVDDRVNSLLTAGSNINLTYDDAANTLTIASTASGGSGIALTDLSVSQSAASGSGLLAYNNTTGQFSYIPPDVSGFATTSSVNATLSSYLQNINGESLYDLSNVNSSANPTDGQVLTWDNANSYWTPVSVSSGGLQNINSENISDLSDVNNTTPSDGQVLTWDNANSYWKPATAATSSSTHPNIVTGTYTTTSTTYVDAGEIVDTDDGFTGAFHCIVSAQIGTGNQASAWFGHLNLAYNKEFPGATNWNTYPWFGNGFSASTHNISAIRIKPRWDSSTNKIYLQVKNGSSTSTVYTWTATLI